ncbi:MAG TPA: hypothetical protein VMH91_01645 [Candidatus Paceibacterota bacterium]|nr:hypothetical protein [Candidatus Paceibacterota bacterium]
MSRRHTDVLLFGQSVDQWMQTKIWMKGSLQSDHMGWSYISNPRDTLHGALQYIAERKDLQIVAIFNDAGHSQEQMIADCTKLAEAIAKHPEKPWVAFAVEDIDYLEPVFESAGVFVANNFSSGVIFERWARHDVEVGETDNGVPYCTCHTCEATLKRPALMFDNEWIEERERFVLWHPSMNGVRYKCTPVADAA